VVKKVLGMSIYKRWGLVLNVRASIRDMVYAIRYTEYGTWEKVLSLGLSEVLAIQSLPWSEDPSV